jgi:hypothetical protein
VAQSNSVQYIPARLTRARVSTPPPLHAAAAAAMTTTQLKVRALLEELIERETGLTVEVSRHVPRDPPHRQS